MRFPVRIRLAMHFPRPNPSALCSIRRVLLIVEDPPNVRSLRARNAVGEEE